jgi:hypothetical protein
MALLETGGVQQCAHLHHVVNALDGLLGVELQPEVRGDRRRALLIEVGEVRHRVDRLLGPLAARPQRNHRSRWQVR